MNALDLNAEIYKHLSVFAKDEDYLKKAAAYLKKLVAQKQSLSELPSSLKQEIEEAYKEIEEGRCAVIKPTDSIEEFFEKLCVSIL